MEIRKETQAVSRGIPTAAQLEAINAQAKAELTAEQVYVFSMRLCDDQIDRDFERFDREALPELSRLFLGKTGVVDHCWSSDKQVARIFETQVIEEEGAAFIKAWAYIRRGGSADEIIADIEAGIKKEVSVGCAMAGSVCSICGSEYGTCGHQKGEHYDGALCCAILKEPVDAYEFSFVAVPAQREAGVLKAMGGKAVRLKDLADRYGAQGEYRELFKEAQLGRQYRKELEDQVVRLSMMLDLGGSEPLFRSIAEKVSAEELSELRLTLQEKVDACYPAMGQLPGFHAGIDTVESEYLI